MTTLVALEPAGLRRLLKGGLRRGLARDDLAALLKDEWQLEWDSPEALSLCDRSWFQASPDGMVWKTRLG
jgi:hypothetical protein